MEQVESFRSPTMWAVAAAAVVGWCFAAFMFWSTASAQDAFRQQIKTIEQERDALAADLRAQRDAAGELADLRAKVASARDELARTATEQNQAQARIAAARSQLAAVEQQLQRAREQPTTTSTVPAETGGASGSGARAPVAPPPRPRTVGRP